MMLPKDSGIWETGQLADAVHEEEMNSIYAEMRTVLQEFSTVELETELFVKEIDELTTRYEELRNDGFEEEERLSVLESENEVVTFIRTIQKHNDQTEKIEREHSLQHTPPLIYVLSGFNIDRVENTKVTLVGSAKPTCSRYRRLTAYQIDLYRKYYEIVQENQGLELILPDDFESFNDREWDDEYWEWLLNDNYVIPVVIADGVVVSRELYQEEEYLLEQGFLETPHLDQPEPFNYQNYLLEGYRVRLKGSRRWAFLISRLEVPQEAEGGVFGDLVSKDIIKYCLLGEEFRLIPSSKFFSKVPYKDGEISYLLEWLSERNITKTTSRLGSGIAR